MYYPAQPAVTRRGPFGCTFRPVDIQQPGSPPEGLLIRMHLRLRPPVNREWHACISLSQSRREVVASSHWRGLLARIISPAEVTREVTASRATRTQSRYAVVASRGPVYVCIPGNAEVWCGSQQSLKRSVLRRIALLQPAVTREGCLPYVYSVCSQQSTERDGYLARRAEGEEVASRHWRGPFGMYVYSV
jgi:hypothetical protein